jgi:hypothetical protein
MRLFGRILFLLFAVVALNGHGVANIVDSHGFNLLDSHDYANAQHSSASGGHVHQHHSVIAGGGGVDPSIAADHCDGVSCEPRGEGHSKSHFHMSCCGAFVALLPATVGLTMFDLSKVDQPMGPASLALGELGYPLLRPPAG